METILKVTGMSCSACVNHVTAALQGVAGVQSATVDLASGLATVQHDNNVAPQQLIGAVVEDGFEAQVA